MDNTFITISNLPILPISQTGYTDSSIKMCPNSTDHKSHSCCIHLPSLVCDSCRQVRCRWDNLLLVSDSKRIYLSESNLKLPQGMTGFTVYSGPDYKPCGNRCRLDPIGSRPPLNMVSLDFRT